MDSNHQDQLWSAVSNNDQRCFSMGVRTLGKYLLCGNEPRMLCRTHFKMHVKLQDVQVPLYQKVFQKLSRVIIARNGINCSSLVAANIAAHAETLCPVKREAKVHPNTHYVLEDRCIFHVFEPCRSCGLRYISEGGCGYAKRITEMSLNVCKSKDL